MEFFSTLDWADVARNAAFVVAVLIIAHVASRSLQGSIRRLLQLNSKIHADGTIFYNIVRVLVWGTAACWILDVVFGFDMAGFLGALGVIGIAVSLGAQETIANVIGGIIVSLSDLVGPDDWVQLSGYPEARVVQTNWRRTTLEDENGVQYAVPNSVMVSSVVAKGNDFYMIVVPFALKPSTPKVEALLVECEQVLLDRMVACRLDCGAKRPKAHVVGSVAGAIQCEVKLYPNREKDTRYVERAVLPPLIELLQERDALAEFVQQ